MTAIGTYGWRIPQDPAGFEDTFNHSCWNFYKRFGDCLRWWLVSVFVTLHSAKYWMKAPKLVKTKKSQLKVPVTTAGRKMQFYRNSNRSVLEWVQYSTVDFHEIFWLPIRGTIGNSKWFLLAYRFPKNLVSELSQKFILYYISSDTNIQAYHLKQVFCCFSAI